MTNKRCKNPIVKFSVETIKEIMIDNTANTKYIFDGRQKEDKEDVLNFILYYTGRKEIDFW